MKPRVLIVEDDKNIRDCYEDIISDDRLAEWLDIQFAKDAFEGRMMLIRERWDLVVLDHNLGGHATGADVLRAKPQTCPVWSCTGDPGEYLKRYPPGTQHVDKTKLIRAIVEHFKEVP